MKAGGRLYIENFNGSLEISGWDQETADVSGTKYASTEAVLEALKIDVLASGDSIRIRTVRPSGHRGNMGARFVIKVPRRTTLERIESSNGAIRVRDVEASARLETSNGSIELTSVAGPVTARTSNGAVRADGIARGIDAETSNGSVRASLAKVEERRLVRLHTSNGAIEFTAEDLGGNAVDASTSNGSITVRLPSATSVDLKARTSNARITNEFESVFEGRSGKNYAEGPINGGGPQMSLSTSNGSIRILRR
jgi:DUF4097 and DUF4098 domain-containing protein YvlB